MRPPREHDVLLDRQPQQSGAAGQPAQVRVVHQLPAGVGDQTPTSPLWTDGRSARPAGALLARRQQLVTETTADPARDLVRIGQLDEAPMT
jgi:hypothetical protein